MYQIIQTENFNKIFNKLIPKNLKSRIKKQILKITKNPKIGKPLSYEFLKELKIDKFRIYYSIYEEMVIILLIGISDKRLQKKTITSIKKSVKHLRDT